MPETQEPGSRLAGHLLAIDPGSEKCGLAVVEGALHPVAGDGNPRTVIKEVVPAGEALARVKALTERYPIQTIVVGDRTGGKAFAQELARAGFITDNHRVVLVDEHLSSQEARRRYLRDHPARGLWRLLPDSLRTPGEPFDDYVAEILAERYMQRHLRAGQTPPPYPS